MKQRTMRSRLILAGIVVVTAIIGATVLIIKMQRIAAIDAFRVATMNLGGGMAQQTTHSIAAVDRVLRDVQIGLNLAPDATVTDIATAMRLKSTSDILTEQRKWLPGIDSLSLVDADGRIANVSGTWPAAPVDISGRDDFRHFRTGDEHATFAGIPVKNLASGKWSAPMARRVDDAQGRFAGLVVADISLTGLQEFYQLAMPPRRSVYLLRRDGVILARYPPRDAEIGEKIPDQSAWYNVVAQGGGAYYAPGYFGGAPIVASVRPLRDLPFVVETSVAETDVLVEWYHQLVWVIGAGIASVIGVIILLLVFARHYRRLELSELSLAMKNSELDTLHEQLDATLANLSQGVCFFANDMKINFCNRRFCEIYDLPEQAIRPGMLLAEIAVLRISAGSFNDRTVEQYVAVLDEIICNGKPQDRVSELRNGRTMSYHFQPIAGRGWVTTIEDITERRQSEKQIEFLARHDILTGLANRALLRERLDQALVMAGRGKGFALLCLDLDRFKAVNDTFGHPMGDSLLRAVADRLRDAVRESDTVARLGGDEFAILQVGVSGPMDCTMLALRIVKAIDTPFELEGRQVSVGTSIGITMAPGDSDDHAQLMKNADLALYRSKQGGRGTWRFFEPAMDAIALERLAPEDDLRCASASEPSVLHYSPSN
jgi:diguanylate cyclase (GGDEF)-like protein